MRQASEKPAAYLGQQHQHQGHERTERQRQQKPPKATTVLALREAGIDQGQRAPSDKIRGMPFGQHRKPLHSILPVTDMASGHASKSAQNVRQVSGSPAVQNSLNTARLCWLLL